MPAHFHMDQSLRPGTGPGVGSHGAGQPAYPAVLPGLSEVRLLLTYKNFYGGSDGQLCG